MVKTSLIAAVMPEVTSEVVGVLKDATTLLGKRESRAASVLVPVRYRA